MAEQKETIDFSSNPPRLIEDIVIDKVRSNFKNCHKIHVFFTGTKISIRRCYDYAGLDNAYERMPGKLVGVYNKNEEAQQYIEKALISDAKESIREHYG